MKTKNFTLMRLISMATILAILISIAPLRSALAAIQTTYFQYKDRAPRIGWSNTGQFIAGDIYYAEGEVVPQKLKITGLTAGTAYGFWILYDYYSAGTCGYDWVADYTTTSRLFTSTTTPDEGGVANGSLSSGGSIYTKGVAPGSVTVGTPQYFISGGLTTAYVPVTFTTSTSNPDVYFGLHLALDGGCDDPTSQGAGKFAIGSLTTQIVADDVNVDPIPNVTMLTPTTPNTILTEGVGQTILTGVTWNDVNANGSSTQGPEAGEPPLLGWTFDLYGCTDSSCTTPTYISSNSTNASGFFYSSTYGPNLVVGSYYKICERIQLGWEPTWPSTTPDTTVPLAYQTSYCTVVQFNDISIITNFGNLTRYFDWGDLPDSFGTSGPSGGHQGMLPDDDDPDTLPNAQIVSGVTYPAIWLGAQIDSEAGGIPTDYADGDDNNATPNDEDGIVIAEFLDQAHSLTIKYNCSSSAGSSSGYLVVWFDWDNSQTFSSSEATFNTPVTCDGMWYTLTPYTGFSSRPESIYYRARLFDPTTIYLPPIPADAFTGLYTNGEVEDYIFYGPTALSASSPVATVRDNSIQIQWQTFNELDIIGFNLYRATDQYGVRSLIYQVSAMHPGSLIGDTYEYIDWNVLIGAGLTYWYWVEVRLKDGSAVFLEPAQATLPLKIYMPVVRR